MADITLILRDQFSNNANTIANANKGLSKSLEEVQKQTTAYTKKLTALNSSLAEQQVKMVSVKEELKEAEKEFKKCADAANESALSGAYIKYNALQGSISDTKETYRQILVGRLLLTFSVGANRCPSRPENRHCRSIPARWSHQIP